MRIWRNECWMTYLSFALSSLDERHYLCCPLRHLSGIFLVCTPDRLTEYFPTRSCILFRLQWKDPRILGRGRTCVTDGSTRLRFDRHISISIITRLSFQSSHFPSRLNFFTFTASYSFFPFTRGQGQISSILLLIIRCIHSGAVDSHYVALQVFGEVGSF